MSISKHSSIIIDWGTSNFRAYRFDGDALIDERRRETGILKVAEGDFEGALRAAIGDWMAPDVDMLFSGMITSRNGWVETPYALTPAALADLRGQVVERVLSDGARLHFLPGVAQQSPQPDVMRGEEIQAFGAIDDHDDAIVILPGTHSKWVTMEKGRIVGFHSAMTGEVFAVLKNHSILGRLIDAGQTEERPNAFARGVKFALSDAPGGFLNHIFTARSGALLGALTADEIPDYLSGVVIGHEVRAGLQAAARDRRVVLVGDYKLSDRYVRALAIAGVAAEKGDSRATIAGFRKLAALR